MQHDQTLRLEPVLDPRQLIRIEAVHRGFMFQHLYGVAILLEVPGSDIQSVSFERDEDIEVRRPQATVYLQLKSRLSALQPNDIADALEHFETLREEHSSGRRSGLPVFAIVSNAEPSAGLIRQVMDDAWPSDVELVTPNRPSAHGLPHAAEDVGSALAQCEAAAAKIPFGGLPPLTLVHKLASIVQHRSAGASDHVIAADLFSPMLEQFVAQLQDFPEPPRPYHPQRNEPPILSDRRVRLIVGFSGSGKTAWASETVRHHSEPIAYFDAGGFPSPAIATNLARELVARFIGSATAAVHLPAGMGMELLRACDRLLQEQGIQALVVLDNAHALDAETFRRLVEAAPSIKFLALAQPWPERVLVEANLQVAAENLEGYDVDAVAAVFSSAGVSIRNEDGLDILAITGGLPLYVANSAQLIALHYGGNVQAFVSAIRAQTNIVDTAQHLILEQAFARLSPAARDLAAFLSMCDVPLSQDEFSAMVADLGNEASRAAALRELRRASAIAITPVGIGLHDALRPLAGAHGATLDEGLVLGTLSRLHLLLAASLRVSANIPRLTFMIRLLPKIGKTDAIVDLATTEFFYEQGNHAVLYETLVAASEDQSASPMDRFWAMDAVAYWQSRDGGTPDADLVGRMADIVASQPDFKRRERLNLLFKQMTIAGTDGDRKGLERLSAAGRRLCSGDAALGRLFRYNRAVALFRMGAFGPVRAATEPLIDEMFKVLGFSEQRLLGANGENLMALVEGVAEPDDVKRTADILNLWSIAVAKSGHFPGLRRLHASKLFAAAGAGRSAAGAAMDAADEFLEFMADPIAARQAIEQNVLPLIQQYGLTDLTLEARGQYAVVLAFCGEFGPADREIALLNNFADPRRGNELANQARLVARIRAGEAKLTQRLPQQRGRHLLLQPNSIGRYTGPDEPCPCGSGRKFKRCHGKV